MVQIVAEVIRRVVVMDVRCPLSLRFIKKAPKRYGSPEVINEDGLTTYGAALRTFGSG